MEAKMAAVAQTRFAERLIGIKDYKGAREKLYKARNLFPALDKIDAMITVCHILVAAADSSLSGGGPDWYWVLQSDAKSNESQIESKYQKLTTLLEPIKDKFPGTESAMSLIDNAFSVLSDERKRSVFDAKRIASRNPFANLDLQEISNVKVSNMEMGTTTQNSSRVTKGANETSDRSNRMSNSRESGPGRSQDASGDCRVRLGGEGSSVTTMKPKVSIGRGKVQSNASQLAGGRCTTGVGSSGGKTSMLMKRATDKRQPDYYDFENIRKPEVFAMGQIWAAYDKENMPRRYARINSIGFSPFKLFVTWLKPVPGTIHEKKWCEVGLPVSCGSFDLDRSNETVAGRTAFSHVISRVKGIKDVRAEIYPKQGEVWAVYRDWLPFNWCSDPKTRNGCGFVMVEILMVYSEDESLIVARLERVAGFASIFQRCVDKGSGSLRIPATDLLRFSHNVPAFRLTGKENVKISSGMFELDPLAVPRELVGCPKSSGGESSSDCSSFTDQLARSPPIASDPETISVKPKWSKKDFISEHIWAVYDGPDSMPQRYVIVNNVISQTEVSATFLDPHPSLSDEIHWVAENLPFVCGLFTAGKITLNLKMSLFSHLVFCERSTKKSFYRIFPKKGEIWAMYKNCNGKWNKSDYDGRQCQIVEILTDFSEATEIKIASLVAVSGFVTFFQRELCKGFELTRTISRMEMLSFSHQIPCFVVPGAEVHGIPEGALHLEPDALPPNLAISQVE